MSQFAQPGIGGDKFEAAKHNGHLLLFFPSAFRADVPTQNGTADCVDTKIVDLDTGETLNDAKVWGKAMVPQLKGEVPDGMVLGRLGQGQGKAGNNPPWILHPHTEQDVAIAERYLAANPRNQFANPGAQQAPAAAPAPAQGGWGAPPAQQAPAQGGWGAPQGAGQAPPAGPTPAATAPAQGGWGSPAPAPAANAPQAGWGAPAAAPAPAPQPDPTSYDEFVAAFQRKGVDPSTITSPEQAAQVWALVKNNPDVA